MSRPFAFLCGLGLTVLVAAAAAQDLVAVPPLKARVTDLTGTLTPQQMATLEDSLAEFERHKGSQIAVLLVPTTRPETIEQYGIRVADAWKVGRKGIDDGAILLVALRDRTMRIEIGYGLEGVIPDAVAKRVVEEVIAPRFRAGDIYAGIRAGTTQLMRLVEGESLPAPAARPVAERQRDWGGLLMVLFVIGITVGGILRAVFGRLLGSAAAGGVAGVLAQLLVGSALAAVLAGGIVFLFTLLLGAAGHGMPGRRGGPWGGGWGGGAPGGGWSSGGGWSGGGGGFGGGGASGRW